MLALRVRIIRAAILVTESLPFLIFLPALACLQFLGPSFDPPTLTGGSTTVSSTWLFPMAGGALLAFTHAPSALALDARASQTAKRARLVLMTAGTLALVLASLVRSPTVESLTSVGPRNGLAALFVVQAGLLFGRGILAAAGLCIYVGLCLFVGITSESEIAPWALVLLPDRGWADVIALLLACIAAYVALNARGYRRIGRYRPRRGE